MAIPKPFSIHGASSLDLENLEPDVGRCCLHTSLAEFVVHACCARLQQLIAILSSQVPCSCALVIMA